MTQEIGRRLRVLLRSTVQLRIIIIIIIIKYTKLASTHIFCPFAIETAGAWHETAIEVTQEMIGRRITVVTEDTRETEFLFQRLSMALQRGNAVSFQNTMITK